MMTIDVFVRELCFYSCSICLVLFIWFKTDAFVEYCSLFRFKKLFYIKDFEEKRRIGEDLLYYDYLVIYRDSFLSRLISCPTCMSVWLGILSYFLHYNFMLIPSSIIVGLAIFLGLSFLERKTYE